MKARNANLDMPTPDADGRLSLRVCPICDSANASVILGKQECPIFHVVEGGTSVDEAFFGRIEIVQCATCGHVHNAGFQESRIEEIYTSQIQTNAPVHATMNQSLQRTVDFMLGNADVGHILEIGGGSGALARQLANQAEMITLIEPGAPDNLEKRAPKNMSIKREMFPQPNDRYFADLVVLRQVLEHVDRPVDFLRAAIKDLEPGARCYVEVPRLEYILENVSPVDLHYMHVHYFSEAILQRMFFTLGLNILETDTIKDGHDKGFLLEVTEAGARPHNDCLFDVPDGSQLTAHLMERFDVAWAAVQARAGKRIALYGACAYSQALSGYLGADLCFEMVFDDTAAYEGTEVYWRGGRRPVRTPNPDDLAELDVIIITAYLHDKVIAARLRELGFSGEILSLRTDSQCAIGGHPPSLFIA